MKVSNYYLAQLGLYGVPLFAVMVAMLSGDTRSLWIGTSFAAGLVYCALLVARERRIAARRRSLAAALAARRAPASKEK